MATKTLFGGLPRWFTLKTERQLDREHAEAVATRRTLETPHGIRSFIDDQQKRVDEMRAKTDAFIKDIENHFGAAAKYLTPAYTGRSKYDNVETGEKRRIGIQWRDRIYTFDDCFVTTISFAYTETKTGVRVDYILRKASGPKEVINDNYDPEADNIYKTENTSDDSFRSVRRYDSHDAFVNSGDHPPTWFVEALSTRKPSH